MWPDEISEFIRHLRGLQGELCRILKDRNIMDLFRSKGIAGPDLEILESAIRVIELHFHDKSSDQPQKGNQ